MSAPAICFIGFGEAGQALASGLRECGGHALSAWDVLFPEAAGAQLRDAAHRLNVRQGTSASDAVAGAEVVVSAVTTSESLAAAAAAKPHLNENQFFLDINSVSPARKREAAQVLAGTARYVDGAMMAPVHPARHRTPILLAGLHAEAVLPVLRRAGMRVDTAGEEIGMAAAIKMMRSVIVKGMEAITFECFVAATRAGVADQVMRSLQESFPGFDWRVQVGYNLERMTRHGIRRAAEMRQVTQTLQELGVDPRMTLAAAEQQQRAGEVRRRLDASEPEPLDGILQSLERALGRYCAKARDGVTPE